MTNDFREAYPSPLAPRPSIQAVIFDLDDTLYLEMSYVQSGFRAVAHWLARRVPGIPADAARQAAEGFEQEMWRAFGSDRAQTFGLMVGNLKLGSPETRPGLVRQITAIYRQHDPDIHLCDDTREVLPKLAKRYRLGLITDGDPGRQRRKMAKLGINEMFPAVILTGTNPEWAKPSATPFRLISYQLGCSSSACVYVADNPTKDFIGPRQVGMGTIRIRRECGLYENLAPPVGGEPDATITNLLELPGLLLSVGSREQGVGSSIQTSSLYPSLPFSLP